MEKTFSKEHTNIAKGIAVIMLIIHHLFYSTDYAYTELQIFGINFWNTLAFFCKTTVAIFVILSGFGLYKSFSKHENITEFYKKHFAKIYLNYWYIWFLFVPAGLFIYGRTFHAVYGDHTIIKLAGNLLGVQNYFGYWGYNPTWWFISLILALYLIFPLLYFLSKQKYILEIIFFVSFSLYAIKCNFNYILCYLPSFIAGILTAKYSSFEKTYTILTKNKLSVYTAIALFCALLTGRIAAAEWTSGGGAGYNSVYDTFLAYLMIMFAYYFQNKNNEIKKYLCQLGELSFYIFLFHTFIFGFYWNAYSYSLNNPVLILFNFVVICKAIAEFITFIKNKFIRYLKIFREVN